MKIGIINCDVDLAKQTNGAYILKSLIEDSIILDICNGEKINSLLEFDGFIITGSGASFDDNFVWINELKEYIKRINMLNKPCLAICFGMQMVAFVFGGGVLRSNANEFGFKSVALKKSAITNESEVMVYQAHNDVVLRPPEKSQIIAQDSYCIQSFVYRNFYCVQFHPEITAEIATIMAKRDGKDINMMLNGVAIDYKKPTEVISRFLSLL